MRQRKKAMVMIFVVIMIAAITTIIGASVDLSKTAVYRQKQSERDARWQYCMISAKSIITEDMVASALYTQNFSRTISGVPLTVTSGLYNSWEEPRSVRATVTGTLDGKSRSNYLYLGKRATVQPCQFGLFVTQELAPEEEVDVDGDVYFNGTFDGSKLSVDGDAYSTAATSPTFESLSGSYIGRQPGLSMTFNDSAYSAAATVTTSGSATLNNPTNLLSLTTSQLRFHSGSLTIKGNIIGEITIYVKGNVVIDTPRNLLGLARLVVICNGDATFTEGTCDVFVICSGKVSAESGGGSRIINGSLACTEMKKIKKVFAINFDSYFVNNDNAGTRYWIPGQW